jgi:hypothetical protein
MDAPEVPKPPHPHTLKLRRVGDKAALRRISKTRPWTAEERARVEFYALLRRLRNRLKDSS